MSGPALTEPLPCPRHTGRHCSPCLGTGIQRCYDCQDAATRTDLADRSIPLCSDCGVRADLALTDYLASVGITSDVAKRWLLALPTLTTEQLDRMCGMSDAEYVEIAKAVAS